MVIRLLVLIAALGAAMLAAAQNAPAPRDLMSDTWVATDALGRRLPGYRECGGPKSGRTVGIFYFLWHGPHGADGPYDITRLLAENPANPAWGPPGAFHHWGKPELGYYLAGDPFVFRKHCRMLVAAGVDVIVFDVTNGYAYLDQVHALCETFREVRAEGGRTPGIAFLANSAQDRVVTQLYDEFYAKNLYPELWFRWLGKPLVMARPDGLRPEIRDFFSFRQSWAWTDPKGWFGDGRDRWPWIDNTPQQPGWHVQGVPEQIAVAVAQHPVSNIGRSYHDGAQPPPDRLQTDEGPFFAEQIRRALAVDPQFVFITGWNEWVAQRFISDGSGTLCGQPVPRGGTYFVDQYTREYSRDIEPMEGGHTDSYYYQMAGFIRRYKGVRRPPAASPAKSIVIDGRFDDWRSVRPEYRDAAGDTERRDHDGWGASSPGVKTHYTEASGRNDFVTLKVARDAANVYFYAETRQPITRRTDPNWMLLFIDANRNPRKGWHGYDYMINSRGLPRGRATVMRSTGGWNWKIVGAAAVRVQGRQLEMAIPRAALGMAGRQRVSFDFHWADNVQKPDDIAEFFRSGDSAPDRRFNYRYDAR